MTARVLSGSRSAAGRKLIRFAASRKAGATPRRFPPTSKREVDVSKHRQGKREPLRRLQLVLLASGVPLRTASELADKAGVSRRTLYNLFRGQRARPDTIRAVARALGIGERELCALAGGAP